MKMKIEFKRLTEVDKGDILNLMNDPLVRKQMPLLNSPFTLQDCDNFIAAKENGWATHDIGHGAFFVDDKFAGWGGLQLENGDPDIALVLHPAYWGIGKILYYKILDMAFTIHGFESVTILFPPSRKHIKGILKLGFVEDGELNINGRLFNRYRLNKKSL